MAAVVLYDPLDPVVAGKVIQYLPSANTPDYDAEVDKLVNPDLSAVTAIPERYWKHSAGAIVEMTQSEKDDMEGGLAGARVSKIATVDIRTSELIASGFTYDSKQFSLSLTAQAKMMGTHQVKDDPALTFPLNWNTIDDLAVYAIGNAAVLDDFYLTGLGTMRTHLDSGTALKDLIRAASTVAAVNAVVDSR